MVERLFLAVPLGCLQFVIVVFPDHTHLLFLCLSSFCYELLFVHFSSAIILKRKRKRVALQIYCYYKYSVALPHGCSGLVHSL